MANQQKKLNLPSDVCHAIDKRGGSEYIERLVRADLQTATPEQPSDLTAEVERVYALAKIVRYLYHKIIDTHGDTDAFRAAANLLQLEAGDWYDEREFGNIKQRIIYHYAANPIGYDVDKKRERRLLGKYIVSWVEEEIFPVELCTPAKLEEVRRTILKLDAAIYKDAIRTNPELWKMYENEMSEDPVNWLFTSESDRNKEGEQGFGTGTG